MSNGDPFAPPGEPPEFPQFPLPPGEGAGAPRDREPPEEPGTDPRFPVDPTIARGPGGLDFPLPLPGGVTTVPRPPPTVGLDRAAAGRILGGRLAGLFGVGFVLKDLLDLFEDWEQAELERELEERERVERERIRRAREFERDLDTIAPPPLRRAPQPVFTPARPSRSDEPVEIVGVPLPEAVPEAPSPVSVPVPEVPLPAPVEIPTIPSPTLPTPAPVQVPKAPPSTAPLPSPTPFPVPGPVPPPLPFPLPVVFPLPAPLFQPSPRPFPAPQPLVPTPTPTPVPLTPIQAQPVPLPTPVPRPAPEAQPQSDQCRRCLEEKEELKKPRTECWKKLVKEGLTPDLDESFDWVPIDCLTGRELPEDAPLPFDF